MKELLFSVTKDDFDFEYFRCGGPGGQAQNKTSSGCRCVHRASRAVGESREERSQLQNKTRAFKRCTESPKFRTWLKIKVAEIMSEETIEEKLEKAMDEKNLKVEVRDGGKWVPEQGWLLRQLEKASEEVNNWPESKQEVMRLNR